MSEDWLRRRLDGLASGGPAAPGDRVAAVLGRARRRTQLRAAAVAVTAAAVVFGATVLVAGGDGGEQGLVAASPDPTSTGASPTASATASATAGPSASASGEPVPTATVRSSGSATPAPAATSGPAADTSVLRLGFIGDVPGSPAGPVPADAGGPAALLRAWVADVNRGGGLGGRPVELLVRDAALDQGQRRRAAQELVDAGVVAVVGSVLSGFSPDAGATLLADNGVPMVGGDLVSADWRTNPLAFAQGTQADELSEGMLAVLGQAAGPDRDAAVVCSDSPACDAIEERVEDGRGDAYDLRGTFVQRVGLSETNYGPVVQRMKAAGTDLVAVQLAWQQAQSLSKEFARQGFRPRQVVVQHDLAEELAEEPATDGWYAVQSVFPHVVRDGAAARFHRVGAGLDLGAPEARTWASAVLLERGVDVLGGARVTRAGLVTALRGLRAERLGGLVPPLDLSNRPTTTCVLVARVAGREWSAPQGLRPTCLAP